MWPVSDRFLAAVRESHRMVVRADLVIDGVTVATLQPLDGSVSVDARRPVRRTFTCSFVDIDGSLAPGQGGKTGLLTPFGSELHIYRGVGFSDGDELVPLGKFVITTVTVMEGDSVGQIQVSGSDRAVTVSRNKFLDAYQIAAGQAVEDAIANLLRDRWADIPLDLPVTGETTTNIVTEAREQGDGWAVARELAEAYGYDLAFDADGVARMRQVPDPTQEVPVQVYEDGTEAVLLSLSRTFDQSRTHNGVVISSQSTNVDTPFRVAAWDDNPASPTYRFGPYGQVPLFFNSELITTPEQAVIVATTMLRRMLGRPESVEWSQIVNPAHDVLDTIRVRRGDLDYLVLIDRLDVPLTPDGQMSAAARSQEV